MRWIGTGSAADKFVRGHPWSVMGLCLVFLLVLWVLPGTDEERAEAVLPMAPALMAWEPGEGPSCERMAGGPAEDLNNVKAFCADGITKEIAPMISRVVAYGEILKIHVDQTMALAMKRSPLDTKRAVMTWMSVWRRITGSRVVTVEVEWEGVPVATGDFSSFGGGDQVTIH